MTSTTILATLIASLAGTAAAAEPKAPPPPTSELSAPAQTGTSDPRYCLRSELTGSRILRRECHTVAQWQKLDVDVLALAKR
jgi:hypothetical protein